MVVITMAIIDGADVGALVTMLVMMIIIVPTISSVGRGGAIGRAPALLARRPRRFQPIGEEF
jgi:hypothetical protein